MSRPLSVSIPRISWGDSLRPFAKHFQSGINFANARMTEYSSGNSVSSVYGASPISLQRLSAVLTESDRSKVCVGVVCIGTVEAVCVCGCVGTIAGVWVCRHCVHVCVWVCTLCVPVCGLNMCGCVHGHCLWALLVFSAHASSAFHTPTQVHEPVKFNIYSAQHKSPYSNQPTKHSELILEHTYM